MSISKQVLIAAAALATAAPATQAQIDGGQAVQGAPAHGIPKPWKSVRGFGRVLDLSKPPVVIDEPGLYAIQQSWLFPRATTEVVPELIEITADNVTLDLHGFTISAESSLPPATVFVITGKNAELRYGGIEARDITAALAVSGGGPSLHHLSVASEERGITFECDGATISDSHILGPIVLAGASSLERNTLRSFGANTVSLVGDGNRVMNNRIFPFRADDGVRITGNGNLVANNVLDAGPEGSVHTGFGVDGDYNVLRGNTVLGPPSTNLRIVGTGNALDGNIAPPPASDPDEAGPLARVGMEFTADGNYYGNNRMAALVPFALGGTLQTDWGGNVGY